MTSESSNPLNPAAQRRAGGLARPTIPGTDPVDGLLPISHFGQPLTLHLVVWDEALPPDTYQLLFNNNLIGSAKSVTASGKPGDLVTLEIPSGLWEQEGIYNVQYLATDIGGGLSNAALHFQYFGSTVEGDRCRSCRGPVHHRKQLWSGAFTESRCLC